VASNLEIEKKFLVRRCLWTPPGTGRRLRQGYLPTSGGVSVRVRLYPDGAALTIKGPTVGAQRSEFEYPIPSDDARQLLCTLCGGRVVDKVRHEVRHEDFVWEVDEFLGENAGLLIAEVEVDEVDKLAEAETHRPRWVGEDVTDDPRFRNSRLSLHPFARWTAEEQAAIRQRIDQR
jgi:CYTH domain-containing protein